MLSQQERSILSLSLRNGAVFIAGILARACRIRSCKSSSKVGHQDCLDKSQNVRNRHGAIYVPKVTACTTRSLKESITEFTNAPERHMHESNLHARQFLL